jgi:SAM-dependent methyltransferase
MNIKHLFRPVTVAEERRFERANVLGKRERYLSTNPMDRYRSDRIYADKVNRVRAGILDAEGNPPPGWILDIGGNTAGEATILCQEGTRIIVADINEAALDISRQRVLKFALTQPGYVAFDVHQIPFADHSIDCVVVLEALHHFPDYDRALAEIHRILKPGGIFYSQEPNGLNPLRRLSELRDRLRGTVEKSFFRLQLLKLCQKAGFQRISIQPGVVGRSCWKVQEVPSYRRWLAVLHGTLQERFPRLFGPHEIKAYKPGTPGTDPAPDDWKTLLRQPGGGAPIHFDPAKQRWQVTGESITFPDLNGIPVLIDADQSC